MTKKDVFHIRLKNIELQTECMMDPGLKMRPVAIISSPHPNGSIISLSPEAEEEGLSRGMKVSVIRKMSNRTRLLPYNRSLYDRIHGYIYRVLSSFTPIVEPQDVGEFFLDMHGMHTLRGNIHNTGLSVIKHIRSQTSLSSIVGISINKLVSRIVTAIIPERIHQVESGKEAQFLAPLRSLVLPTAKQDPVHRLLKFLLVKQVGQIQSMTKASDDFQTLFGVHAPALYKESQGYDTSLVRPFQLKDHILEQTILPEDTNDESILYAVVKDLSEQMAFKLRQRKQIADKVRLEIHYTDGYKRQGTGVITRIDDLSVFNECKRLFESANDRRNRIRTILLDVWGFQPYKTQENLFSTTEERNVSLSMAIDKIRSKYGVQSLQTANVFQALMRT